MRDHQHNQDTRSRVRDSFRRGLDTYHDAAVAQKRIAQDLVALLQQAGAPQQLARAFEFGCGTGHLTHALISTHDINTLLLNDLVDEAKDRVCHIAQGQCPNVEFMAGAIEQLALPNDLDLVASASTLQWVRDGRLALEHLCGALNVDGYLALSTFGTSHFHELVALGSDAAAPNYSDAETLAGWLPAGMELVALKQAPVVLEFASASQVLRHLRATGVNARSGRQWSKRMVADFDASYRGQFGDGTQLPLTYDTVWMIARKV